MKNKKIRDYIVMPALMILSLLIVISAVKTFEFFSSREFLNGDLQVDAFLILLIAAPFWFLLKYVWDKVEIINIEQHIDGQKTDSIEIYSTDDSGVTEEQYEKGKEIVLLEKKASTALIQREVGLPYEKALKIIEMLEERGVVGPQDGATPREIFE